MWSIGTRWFDVALIMSIFAVGNVLGPLILGPLFDRIGRRAMIGATYALSGVGLLGGRGCAWGPLARLDGTGAGATRR